MSWWSGDGNAQDIVDGNHGTLTGDATYAQGIVGQGFSLDGTGDFVLVPDSPNLNITGDVTVDLWARRTVFGGNTPGGDQVMVTKGAGSIGAVDAPTAYILSFTSGDRLLGGFERSDASNVLLEGPTVTDTNPHHYAYVRSGQTHKLVLDGVVVTSGDFTGSPGDTSGIDLLIGALGGDTVLLHFGGVIDEVEIFDRALTDAEVKAIYDAGSLGKKKPQPIEPPAGMVNWWPGDGHALDIVDSNHGTLQNGATFATGMVGQAFSFDGTGDYVQIAQDTFDGLIDATADAWVKFDVLESPLYSRQTIISALKGGVAHHWTFGKSNIGDLELFFTSAPAVGCSVSQFFQCEAGRFYHIAATKSGGTIKLYVQWS